MMTTTEVQDLIEVNRFLAEVAAERREALWVAIRDRETNGIPIPEKVSDSWEKGNAMLHKSVVALAMNAPVGTLVITADGGLIVASIGSIRDDKPIEVVLTEDGSPAERVWDERVGETRHIRYEVYTTEGCVAHGWIAEDTRKIVQTG